MHVTASPPSPPAPPAHLGHRVGLKERLEAAPTPELLVIDSVTAGPWSVWIFRIANGRRRRTPPILSEGSHS